MVQHIHFHDRLTIYISKQCCRYFQKKFLSILILSQFLGPVVVVVVVNDDVVIVVVVVPSSCK